MIPSSTSSSQIVLQQATPTTCNDTPARLLLSPPQQGEGPLEDYPLIDEEILEESNWWELPDIQDLENLLEEEALLAEGGLAVHTVVAAVPTARVQIPRLTGIEAVFEWMEDVQRYVALAEASSPPSEVI